MQIITGKIVIVEEFYLREKATAETKEVKT